MRSAALESRADRDPPARLDPAHDRRAVAPARRTPRAPARYVRFCGGELQLRARWIDETLAVIDDFEPEYLDLLADLAPYSYAELTHEWLGRQVGGDEALAKLDDDPLPDEPFGWDGIPDDVCDRVREVLDECDRCAAELFDVEYRTACRRLLAAVAVAEPVIFRRRARTVTAASAICWIVGKANHALSWYGGVMVKDMAGFFGIDVPAVSARAHTLLRALGLAYDDYSYGEVFLHSTAYLTSTRRHAIIAERNRAATLD